MLSIWTTRRSGPLFASHIGMSLVHGGLLRVFGAYVAASGVPVPGLTASQAATLSLAVYAAPFLVLSGPAGRLADRIDKAQILRWTSIAGILVTGFGVFGWILGSPLAMLLAIGLAGAQAAVVLPARYAAVAEHLDEPDWIAGHASLLLGTLSTGMVFAIPYGSDIVVAGARVWHDGVVADAAAPLALVGASAVVALIASLVSPLPPVEVDPDDVTAQERAAAAPRTLIRYPAARWSAVTALVWYWTIGGMLLELLPLYVGRVIGAGPEVTTWFLLTFGVGTLLGTLGATALSRRRVELGLVPLGSLGLSVFLGDLWLVGGPYGPGSVDLVTWETFVTSFSGLRITIDCALIAMSGVLVAVPLVSYLQLRSEPDVRGAILGASQRLNAVGVMTGSLLLVSLLGEASSPTTVLLGVALANLAIAGVIYHTIAEFLLRFAAWVASFAVYRVRTEGIEHVPEEGPAVLVANHVSFIDWLVIMAVVRRPIRFVMYWRFLDIPVLKYLFRQNKVIPIAGRKENEAVMEAAFEQVHAELADGWLVLIFPEGDLTRDGAIAPFRNGVERILQRDPVPVVPIALNGLWGSFFSHAGGSAMTRPFRRVWSKVWITVGPPVDGATTDASSLQSLVEDLHRRHSDP